QDGPGAAPAPACPSTRRSARPAPTISSGIGALPTFSSLHVPCDTDLDSRAVCICTPCRRSRSSTVLDRHLLGTFRRRTLPTREPAPIHLVPNTSDVPPPPFRPHPLFRPLHFHSHDLP